MARSESATVRLEAAAAAKRLHRHLGIEKRVSEVGGSVDVFEAISDLDIPLVFKKLDSALGLYLPSPAQGILITTERTLNIQRFTAAHELGHATLDHEGSVDQEIFERGPFQPQNGRDLKEVAADAFAAEFILPRWLYRLHVRKQGWSVSHLRNPDIVYQLSLRLGASYDATCWGLLSHQILDRRDINILRDEKVAVMKRKLGEGHRPSSSWADVWRITERDNGSTITGTELDLVQLEFHENASSGSAWDIAPLTEAGLEVLSDASEFSRDPLVYGAESTRKIVARPTVAQQFGIRLRETRPWSHDVDAEVALNLAFNGAEKVGWSRVERSRRGLD